MTIQSQEKLPIDLGALLASLSADVAGDFGEGSVAVYFNGTIMPLVGQLTMTDPKRRVSFESELVDNSPGLGLLPPRLNALWWGLGGGREATIAVTNTSGASATADVFLDFLGRQHSSAPLVFSPHETKVLAIAQLLGDLKISPSQAPEGCITIVARAPTPSLAAQGKIIDPATGFSTTLNFPDPLLQVSSALHASGVPIGVPAKGSPFAGLGAFVPHVIVRNLAPTPQSVAVTVEYPAADGPQQIVLPAVALGGYATQDLPLDTALGLLPLPLPYCSIRIQYSGPPGSAMAEVSSIEARGDLVIDSRLANEGDGWAGSGAHPWHLDEETESILFLTNMGDRECPIGFQLQAGGVYYHVVDLSLRPHETKAIDLRKLRNQQKPDFQGNMIPAGATDGAVNWIRLDNVPVMGRLVVLQRHRGVASNYDCSPCVCPPSYQNFYIIPSSATMRVGDSQQFRATVASVDCNYFPYYIDLTASSQSTWNSSQPSYVSLDGSTKGLTHALAGGASNIGDNLSNVCIYQYYPPYPVCFSTCWPTSNYSTAYVVTITGPQTVWWFNGQSPSGYTTSITLTATPSAQKSYSWAFSAGSNKASFSGQSGNTINLTGNALSAGAGDVKVKVTVTLQDNSTKTSADYPITVRGPYLLVPGTPNHQPDSFYGYVSYFPYTIRDNLSQDLPNVGINESFSTLINDFPGTNWVRGPAIGYSPSGATFTDIVQGQPVSPPPYPFPTVPSTPLGTTAVHHFAQSWFVGSTTPGSGARVQTNTLKRYVDHAAHEGITSPAP